MNGVVTSSPPPLALTSVSPESSRTKRSTGPRGARLAGAGDSSVESGFRVSGGGIDGRLVKDDVLIVSVLPVSASERTFLMVGRTLRTN